VHAHDTDNSREDTMPEDSAVEQPRYADLADKVAVVTGGSRGIGAATARALAANRTIVAILGGDEEALASVTDDIQAQGGQELAVRADCTVEVEVYRAADTITEQLGAVDILAAFAGGNGMPVPTRQETAADWGEVIESNLTSTFLTLV
jgi:3-oxoacyl-[acyl-carrier protein] reductase